MQDFIKAKLKRFNSPRKVIGAAVGVGATLLTPQGRAAWAVSAISGAVILAKSRTKQIRGLAGLMLTWPLDAGALAAQSLPGAPPEKPEPPAKPVDDSLSGRARSAIENAKDAARDPQTIVKLAGKLRKGFGAVRDVISPLPPKKKPRDSGHDRKHKK